jgi:hypothetical protein
MSCGGYLAWREYGMESDNGMVWSPTIYFRRKQFISGKCVNKHSNCQMWAETGQCTSGAEYMMLNCYKACTPDECGGDTGGTGKNFRVSTHRVLYHIPDSQRSLKIRSDIIDQI